MAPDPSLRAFKCPSCGAPLEPEVGTLTMKCSYCGGTVIIPESLRTPPKSAGPTFGEVFDFGLRGLDMSRIVGNAMQLPHAISLAQQGQIDEAASIYSQITGMEHTDAIAAVEALAKGHAVSLTPGQPGMVWGQPAAIPSWPPATVSTAAPVRSAEPEPRSTRRTGCGLLTAVIAAVGIVVIGLLVAAYTIFRGQQAVATDQPAAFAATALTFGSEGIGAGMFQDPRAISVSKDGDITVADFQDGRIQTFDAGGTFKTGFSINAAAGKTYVTSMAVGRDGEVYVAHNFLISVFDPVGNETKQIRDDRHHYDSVTFGGDGKLYAISDSETIVRLKPDYTIDLEVPDTFTNVAGDKDIETHLAVDGLGNMYILGAFHDLVLKYGPKGNYIDQFGGKAGDSPEPAPGKFVSPNAIAVDGFGRVYVSDFSSILVFDSDGSYVNRIPVEQGVAFGLAVDNSNRLYAVTNQARVIQYDVKAPTAN